MRRRWWFGLLILLGVAGTVLAALGAWQRGLLLGPRLERESDLFVSFTTDLRHTLGRRDLPPELDGYRRLVIALARWPAGRRQVEDLAGRTDGVGYQACLVLARSRHAREQATAADWYLRALELRDDPGVREELARLLEECGQPAQAVEHWKHLLPARVAVEALLRLEPDWCRVAEWLNDRGWAQPALEILREHEESEARARAPVAREWGRALLTLGDARAALPWLARYLAEFPDDGATLAVYARALEKSGKLEAAAEAYGRLGPAGARGLGRVLERLGRRQEAARAYLESPEAEARWRGACLLEELGRPLEALAVYRSLAGEKGLLRDDAALRGYVLSRSRGDTREAGRFRVAISPGLAWCAGLEVEHPLPYPPVPDPAPPPAAAAVRALEGLGRRGTPLAQVEVEVLARHGGPTGRLAVAEWYAGRGNVTMAAERAMSVLPDLPAPAAYRLAYPRPYPDLVGEVSAAFGVDPFLVWAVMREESHFAAWAVSPAGACGLMQLMPATAEGAARALGMKITREDLFRPEVNLRLGTWYLARMIASCGGDIPRALAAYNGGLGNVRRWAASPVFRGTEGFPTAISFSETREYVARVAGSYLVYRHLYGHGGSADGTGEPSGGGTAAPQQAVVIHDRLHPALLRQVAEAGLQGRLHQQVLPGGGEQAGVVVGEHLHQVEHGPGLRQQILNKVKQVRHPLTVGFDGEEGIARVAGGAVAGDHPRELPLRGPHRRPLQGGQMPGHVGVVGDAVLVQHPAGKEEVPREQHAPGGGHTQLGRAVAG